MALLSTADQQMVLWQLTPQVRARFRWQQQSNNDVFIVKFAPQHRYAISASRHDFAIWSTQSGESQGYWQVGQSVIRDIALSANGEQVIIGLENSKVIIVNVVTGRRLEFLGHSEAINQVRLSANGRYAFTAGNDHQALLWDTQSAQIIQRFTFNSRITQLALDPEGHLAFVADSQNKAYLYAIPSGRPISHLAIHVRQKIFSSARFVHHGQWLLTGSPNRQLQLWDVRSGQLMQEWKVGVNTRYRPASAVVYDAVIDDNNRIISASSSGLVEYWTIK
ncbi:WD40 repeat domain-containing protein [Celerinatantimonas sp. YJH-8]|uniref:WD40 repeat domain-containing protein n=1 Tax=Celerinatantimonas sp. YJH-8 TaxID=3228714 RepID=UPI0038BF1CA6